MRIHQFVHTLNYGDAISTEAIAIRRLLREAKIESEIYSLHAHEKVEHLTRKASFFESDMQSGASETAVILHYSIASPLNQLFSSSPVKRALIYHNLTPVEWFTRYNTRVAEDLRRGLAELPPLLDQAELVLADSKYNGDELRGLGARNVEILPLFFDAKQWTEPANRGIAGVLKGHGGKNLLHVGRLAPNKRIEDIIKAFYFYHHKIEPKSRLWLIGSDIDTEIYSFELRRLVSELRLKPDVFFVGSVSNGELRAFYECSDAYLCMSEHEGFCLPLLEAMHFSLPIIAFGSCAVPETAGDAALLLGRKNPAETAELINLVLTREELRRELQAKGRDRVRRFSETEFKRELTDKIITRLSTGSRKSELENQATAY